MEEDEFRSRYAEINEHRCVFEKAINARRCNCSKSRRFMLAGREGVGCNCANGLCLCTEILDVIREKAKFSLHLTQMPGALPHNKEIRVQVGGMQGLRDVSMENNTGKLQVEDIHGVIRSAIDKFESIDAFPYSEIVKSVAACEGRRRQDHFR